MPSTKQSLLRSWPKQRLKSTRIITLTLITNLRTVATPSLLMNYATIERGEWWATRAWATFAVFKPNCHAGIAVFFFFFGICIY
ncbi:hypothetical protein BJV78DRAFT_1191919, partial [Lactifluus subvellereus]